MSTGQVTLDILKKAAMVQLSKELVNIDVEVADGDAFSLTPTSQILVRSTQRLLAMPARDEQVSESEEVAVGWFDHLLLSVTDRFVNHDTDWDEREGFWWRLRDRANTRHITKRSTIYYACPHVEIPVEKRVHIDWLLDQGDFEQ